MMLRMMNMRATRAQMDVINIASAKKETGIPVGATVVVSGNPVVNWRRGTIGYSKR